ncbi:MAG: branched-chain amino acid aminotransferase [Victivallaceae bacterium]|nr:branched-chain amino acid aminotransferase [Victivallaceae bacterium]
MMNINWDELGFGFMPVKSNIRFHYENGKWSEPELTTSYEITLNVAANCLHYGQALFEGGKAFTCADGRVCIFRPDENAKRLNSSARYLQMPEIDEKVFVEAVRTVVRDNIEYVPPYGTGGALYIRPVMFGTSPQIGVNASKTYELIIMVVPVGAYYKGGIRPVKALIPENIDRAAPHGTGHIKAAGNYAASLYPSRIAHEAGCSVALFLDPREHKYVDEFGTSNFIGITRDGVYVTPASPSILPSITNKSLAQVAEDLGMKVERRRISVEELETLTEVGACGTAVVLTPVSEIIYGDKVFKYGTGEIGPVFRKLYDAMTGIQHGTRPDIHHWLVEA